VESGARTTRVLRADEKGWYSMTVEESISKIETELRESIDCDTAYEFLASIIYWTRRVEDECSCGGVCNGECEND